MAKLDPIIAVKNVEASADWYRSVFGWKNLHGGKEFAIMVDENEDVVICLHEWEADEHPTMMNPNITPGNGLILYFRTENVQSIRQNVEKMDCAIEDDIHENPNSTKIEFSLRDLDGYFITITDFHKYDG
jgi:hypothetical protein